jgi:electron transport complex protein RnfG
MKFSVNDLLRYSLVLAVICAGASASLGFVHAVTKDRIIAQARAEENSSLQEVMPGAVTFEPVTQGEEIFYYKALAADSTVIGYCFKAQAKGYSSVIETVAGMLPDGTLTAIKVLSQNETPGLGTRVKEESFTSQFKGLFDVSGVHTIAGATISSRAVISSVSARAREIKEAMRHGG